MHLVCTVPALPRHSPRPKIQSSVGFCFFLERKKILKALSVGCSTIAAAIVDRARSMVRALPCPAPACCIAVHIGVVLGWLMREDHAIAAPYRTVPSGTGFASWPPTRPEPTNSSRLVDVTPELDRSPLLAVPARARARPRQRRDRARLSCLLPALGGSVHGARAAGPRARVSSQAVQQPAGSLPAAAAPRNENEAGGSGRESRCRALAA
jgi:hypothetical protein